MKGNKGITLIALVITIIVLLILAGVSIAMLSGNNSILGNASKSADYNKIGEIKDRIGLKINEYTSSYLENVYNNGTYVGTAGVNSNAAAVIDAIKVYASKDGVTTNGVTGKLDDDTTPTTITLTSNSHSVTGEINSTTGTLTWGNIQ